MFVINSDHDGAQYAVVSLAESADTHTDRTDSIIYTADAEDCKDEAISMKFIVNSFRKCFRILRYIKFFMCYF